MLIVEFSPGGTDDGSGIVILLELLTNLVNDPTLTYSQVQLIVFFTSAEEMNRNGADAFVQHHKWATNVRRFINIDSSGSKDRALLFRVRPSQVCYKIVLLFI
jgi:Zn-dependent M28 family amino/carboxypeptidase